MTPLLIAALLSQEVSPSRAAETRTITFSVVDDKGQPVRTLGPDDVAVQENGVARQLERLELDQRPLAVAVLLDSSVTMAPHYRLYLVDAVLQFLLRLPEGTKYALWTTGDRPVKVYDWGDNRAAAAKALRRVAPQGGNTLLDAMVEAARDLKHREDARSAMVVVTGTGIGFASYDRRQVVDELEKHPMTVLSVAVDEGSSSSPGLAPTDHLTGVDYDYVLSTLAKSTGGVRETVLSAMGIERGLRGIAAQLTSQYRLTYASAAAREAKVEVTVALPGVKVRMGAPRR